MRKTTTKTRLKIVSATATVVFSLASVFAGTYAWFFTQSNVTATGMSVAVVSNNCTIESLNLYKFTYAINKYGDIDYLSPQDGNVNKYPYISPSGFGVTEMNVYDPIEKVVMGSSFDLRNMNCNAVYEATISTNSLTEAYLDASAIARQNVLAGNNQTLLSTCVDFDLYFESEIADENNGNLNLTLYSADGKPKYLPSNYSSPLNIVYCGPTAPNNGLGGVGDLYLNTTNKNLYLKAGSSWGNPLNNGVSTGTETPTGTTDSLSYYVKTNTDTVYRYIDSWMLCSNAYLGVQGAYTNSEPSAESSNDGDYYLDYSSESLKRYVGGEGWTTVANTQGYYFIDSATGDLYLNNGGWSSVNTNLGDNFLDSATGELKKKSENSWENAINITSEKIYYKISYLASLNLKPLMSKVAPEQSGASAPTNAIAGSSGDKYICTNTHDLYIKTDNSWGSPVGVKKGLTGSSGYSGDSIPVSPSEDDYFFDETNNSLKQFDGSEWQLSTPLSGDYYFGVTTLTLYQFNGLEWERANINKDDYFFASESSSLYQYNGTTWAAANCVSGDYFIDVVSHSLKVYNGSSWENVVPDLTGVNPPQEVAGNPGSKYIETTNNDLYIKAPTSWGNPLSIRKGTVGTSLPLSPSSNDYFFDTSMNVIKQYDGSSWNIVSMGEGDYFIDIETNELYRFQNHAHFYDNGDPTLCKNNSVSFADGPIKLYVNVNYSPEQLEDYTEIVYLNKTTAIHDFAFSFNFQAGD